MPALSAGLGVPATSGAKPEAALIRYGSSCGRHLRRTLPGLGGHELLVKALHVAIGKRLRQVPVNGLHQVPVGVVLVILALQQVVVEVRLERLAMLDLVEENVLKLPVLKTVL